MSGRRATVDSDDEDFQRAERPVAEVPENVDDAGQPPSDEESGDDAMNSQASGDSSEEESDNPDEARRIREGFIVSDEEGDDGDSDSSSKEIKKRKRRHQRVAEPEFDEDDLELVREATGTRAGTRFKRLKRARSGEVGAGSGGGLDTMFSDEGDDDEIDQEQHDRPQASRHELDDFIEEDEFSDDEALRRQEERETARGTRRSSARTGSHDVVSTLSGLDEEKVSEIYEVFGDGEDYEWALEGEGEGEEDEALGGDEDETGEGLKRLDLKDVFEPSELQARMLTSEDNAIRAADVPERYQLLRQRLRHGADLDAVELYELKAWVADSVLESKRTLLIDDPELREPLRDAVHRVVEYTYVDNLEIPFIWHQRQDYLVDWRGDEKLQLLDVDDLWKSQDAAQDYLAMREMRTTVRELWASVEDDASADDRATWEESERAAALLVDWQDIQDWLQFRFSSKLAVAAAAGGTRRHARFGAFDRIRSTDIYDMIQALNMTWNPSGSHDAPEREPNSDETSQIVNMVAQELSQDPRVRRWLRQAFEERAVVNIVLTEDGRLRIGPTSPFADIKYAANWSLDELKLRPELYLRMLQAETQGLVIVRLQYPSYKTTLYEEFVSRWLRGDEKYDAIRRQACKEASRRAVPVVTRTIREALRLHCSRSLGADVRHAVLDRLDQAPYKPAGYVFGTMPRVLALSAGPAGPADAVLAAFLDEEGRLVETAKLGDSRDSSFREALIEMVKRTQPDVIGVAGMSPNTRRIYSQVSDIISEAGLEAGDSETALRVTWVQDEVARLYRNTPRALQEFPQLVEIARYCVSLGRYLQSPLLEYASLGLELLRGIPFHSNQSLLSEEDFNSAAESAFVDIVNQVGVDINSAARSSYIATLVPYIAGLGPRKASQILGVIQARGGINERADLIIEELTTRTVFVNCAAFIKFPPSEEYDILDTTRIHPEDYELARKMAADALELDEEDYSENSNVVAQLFEEDPEAAKLNELVLEEYAGELETKFHRRKRCTLIMIRQELQDRYRELRRPLVELGDLDVFTMLTGESKLPEGSVVSAVVRRATGRQITLALNSGVDAVAESGNISDDRSMPISAQFAPGQAVQVCILSVDYKALFAQVSTRQSVVADALHDAELPPPVDSSHWNQNAADRDVAAAKARVDHEMRQTRVIKHPLFRPFSARQAEEYLAPLQRGDLVIRPSSRGLDHLVVTWKVGEMLYQHIDVKELDKPNEYALGHILQIGQWRYSDLDELIIMHIQSMAQKVEEMTQSEKFQAGNRADVEKWLTAYTTARPNQSVYAYCFDHKRPGYFLLCFKTGAAAKVHEWHVKVIPNGYELMGNAYPDVHALSNGFKLIWQSRQKRA